ncbi:MAG: SAF domain-containing protein [Ilumatobacteraceae bacterium]
MPKRVSIPQPSVPVTAVGAGRSSIKGDPAAVGRALRASLQHRGIRTRELAMGVAVLVGSVGLFVAMSGDEPRGVAVLTARTDLKRGTEIDQSMLGSTMVAADADMPYLPAGDASAVIGLISGVDIEQGALMAPSMLEERLPLGSNEALIGLTVGLEGAPSELASGDSVRLILVRDDIEEGRVVTEIESPIVVWSVGVLDDLTELRPVSLRVPLEVAATVAGHDVVRIVKVGV